LHKVRRNKAKMLTQFREIHQRNKYHGVLRAPSRAILVDIAKSVFQKKQLDVDGGRRILGSYEGALWTSLNQPLTLVLSGKKMNPMTYSKPGSEVKILFFGKTDAILSADDEKYKKIMMEAQTLLKPILLFQNIPGSTHIYEEGWFWVTN
ncbi:hypothetical protein HDV05_008344, partial [Chytridiales sp. JEL 0842]